MSDLSTSVRNAPLVPGLTFRYYRGPQDFPGMVAVYDACRPVDGYEWPRTVDDFARMFAHLEHCDPYRDMTFAEMGGETIGFGRGSWYRQPDGAILHDLTGHVDPGLAPPRDRSHAILRWTEERQAAVAERGPGSRPTPVFS